MLINLEAVQLNGRWYVMPAGQVGTCGFYPTAWSLFASVRCRTAEQAIAQCQREAAWASKQTIPRVLGAVEVRVGQFKGQYEDDEIAGLIKQMLKKGAAPGPYGLYWVYDGDCYFEECSFAFEGDSLWRSWGGINALSELIAEYKKELLLCNYVW